MELFESKGILVDDDKGLLLNDFLWASHYNSIFHRSKSYIKTNL